MDIGARPYALVREEGRAVGFLGTLGVLEATSEQTGGTFGIIDNLMPAGFASPYHTHCNENESYYVGVEKVNAEASIDGLRPRAAGTCPRRCTRGPALKKPRFDRARSVPAPRDSTFWPWS